jgi:hypothetical protein
MAGSKKKRRNGWNAGRLGQAARDALSVVIDGAREHYDRSRHLPRLIPVGPADIADDSPAGRRAILARLARALRAERNRGRAGHWTYDLNRHVGLAQAYAAERARAGGSAVPETTKPPPGPGDGF